MEKLENKINILKIRISNLIDEHADALAEAQGLHKQLQEARTKISDLEERLRNRNVQTQPEVTIIDAPMEPTEN